MQIVKDKNNVVVFVGSGFKLSEDGLTGNNFKAPTVTSKEYVVEDVKSVPKDYTGGAYTYDGQWLLTEKGEKLQAEKLQARKKEARREMAQKARKHLDSVMSEYSIWEAVVWPILIKEAERFQIDGTVGEYMEAEIGVKYKTAADLATVILQRKENMKQIRAKMVLDRQREEAAIDSAKNIEELNSSTKIGGRNG